MQTGAKISGVAHVGLILAALFGGAFSSEPPEVEVAEVSLISAEQFAALSAGPVPQAEPQTAVAPSAEAQPETPPPTEPNIEPEAVQEVTPEPAPEPEPEPVVEAPEPEPEPEPEPTPQAEAETAPPPVERVAPEPAPAPEVQPDPEARPEVAQDQNAETQTERQEATAPPEATDRIRPEPPDQEVALAPARSIRPTARPPARAPSPDPTPAQPAAEPAPAPRDTAAAVNSALAAALGGGETEAPVPAGPPLSAGEKDALRVSVSQCWNVGSLSSAALATTVVVSVSLGQDGKPETGSIRMLSSSGGDAGSARQAFEAARRAIIRCGARGFDLPSEKYAHWRDVEMTFNPERMRIR